MEWCLFFSSFKNNFRKTFSDKKKIGKKIFREIFKRFNFPKGEFFSAQIKKNFRWFFWVEEKRPRVIENLFQNLFDWKNYTSDFWMRKICLQNQRLDEILWNDHHIPLFLFLSILIDFCMNLRLFRLKIFFKSETLALKIFFCLFLFQFSNHQNFLKFEIFIINMIYSQFFKASFFPWHHWPLHLFFKNSPMTLKTFENNIDLWRLKSSVYYLLLLWNLFIRMEQLNKHSHYFWYAAMYLTYQIVYIALYAFD